jgi:hypothetical protein
MPIHAKTNLYPGVNAHLNSLLITMSGWRSFHAGHVEHIREDIDRLLPAGYFAESEESLQIGILEPLQQETRRIQPDVTLFRKRSNPGAQAAFPQTVSSTKPDVIQLLSEVMPDVEDTPNSVVIYHARGEHAPKPITRIEVISPGNKRPDPYAEQYARQRSQTLRGGMALVEIDYIYTRRPLLDTVADYHLHEDGAYPYMVLMSNPREPEYDGTFAFYGIGVVSPLPTIVVPLLGGDFVTLDLAQTYNRTFLSRIRRYSDEIDYATDPVALDRYHPDDQAKLRQFLSQIRAEHMG